MTINKKRKKLKAQGQIISESRSFTGGLVRGNRLLVIAWSLTVGCIALPARVLAQEQTSSGGEQPQPDPGGLDIQSPHPRVLAMITLGAPNEYRDRLLSDRNTISISGGIAYKGFSASAWFSNEISTDRTSHELLIGYSYKFPVIDLHAALVSCSNQRMIGGCADGVRLTASSNSISRTTLEASFDQALASDRKSYSLSAVRDLWQDEQTSGALRIGWTRTDYGRSDHLDGFSVRLIAERQLGSGVALSFVAGSAWTSGRAQPASAQDGPFATTSLVWRY